jgi:hypothetical protein
MKRNLIEIAKSLASDIRERFPRDEFLEAMFVVYPQYWNLQQNREAKIIEFLAKLSILVHQFVKNHNVQGEEIEGILDSSKLYQQANIFGQTMLSQYFGLEKPIDHGAITILWTKLGESQYLEENM